MISYHTAIPPTPLHLTKTDTDGEVVLTIASMMKPPVFTSPPDMNMYISDFASNIEIA